MTNSTRSVAFVQMTLCCGMLAAFAGCNGQQSEGQEPSAESSEAEESSENEGTGQAGDEAETQVTSNSREGWPTEQEAIDAILKVERAIRASPANREIYYITDLRHEVHSVQFGERTVQKWMDSGFEETTYPTRIVYTRITEHSNAPDDVEECGADGTWYLYRDEFGEWTGRYSSN